MGIKTVKLPHLGESVTEAQVTEWLVQPGDKVERYTPLMEVVSDKVLTEVPSDFEGTIKELLVDLNTSYPIGTALMTMEVEGQGDDEAPAAAPAKQEAAPAQAPAPAAPVAATPAPTPAPAAAPAKQAGGRFSPAVLKIAQEKGIDLALVVGTGKDGRITRKDVQNYDPANAPAPVAATPAPAAAPAPVASAPAPSAPAAAPVPVGLEDKVVAADPIRKAIATKMVQSVNEIPHAWIMVEADVTNIVNLRNKVKNQFKETEGINLSFFPFFAKAVVQALKKNPKLNTQWDNGNIIYKKDINLSIAITTDEHLYVPVIQNADNYSLAGLAKKINELATDVKAGTLSTDKMMGGTFTLNNTGSIGSVQSMGIINHPQAAILQVESIVKRMVPTADGGFRAADMINLCLSIDHRILDGIQAGNFLKDVKENLARFSDEGDIY